MLLVSNIVYTKENTKVVSKWIVQHMNADLNQKLDTYIKNLVFEKNLKKNRTA
jgi:macrodomain Ter protein organizer (MatP/YcbG family)